MQSHILVYGWYNQGNIGDELFKDAFTTLFPNLNLVFTPRITPALLKDASAVFIGGGSFLYAPLNMADGAFDLLKKKKIFYIGVGLETEIHPMHQELMSLAQLIATRTPNKLQFAQNLNPNSIVIPDIVYSLKNDIKLQNKIPKSVLVIPNMAVVPQHSDPHWKHAAWTYFKSEFSQFLDFLIEEKYSIKFLSMCQNAKSDDHWASTEIISSMQNRADNYLLNDTFEDIDSITSIISQYETIITQRFHGIVLSELARVPYISLYHHDKLKQTEPGSGIFLSYYGISKNLLKSSFLDISNNFSKVLLIEDNIFEELRKGVSDSLNNG